MDALVSSLLFCPSPHLAKLGINIIFTKTVRLIVNQVVFFFVILISFEQSMDVNEKSWVYHAGDEADTVQEVDEEVQRGMVGILVPIDSTGLGIVGVCAGGEGRVRPCAHARPVLALHRRLSLARGCRHCQHQGALTSRSAEQRCLEPNALTLLFF